MRISTSMMYDLGVGSIQQQSAALTKTSQQVATGRRILTPADDPVAAARVLEVSQSKALNTQYDVNADSATSALAMEESALVSVGNLIQDVRTIAVNAGNPTLDNSNLASLAADLRGRYQELLGIANSTDGNGQYMFSGYKGSTMPFAETSPGVVKYSGDQGQRLMQISPSRQLAVSDAGSDVFMQIKNGNGTFVTAVGGNLGPPVTTSNLGTGLVSAGTVLDPAKWSTLAANENFEVQFRNLPTSVTPTLGVGEEIRVTDSMAWSTASQNASVNFTAAGLYTVTANGTTSAPVAYTGTPISIQGTGLSFNFEPSSFPATYNVSGSSTTYDIVDSTNTSILTAPRAYTSGSTISLSGLDSLADYGVELSIEGVPADGDTFTIKPSTNESIFTTLDNLITALETANVPGNRTALTNNLNTALSNFDNGLDQVLTVRASVGARMKENDSVKSTGQDVALQYDQTLSSLQDLDYAKALSDLEQQTVILEAAQKSFIKTQGLSLFNYI